MDPKVATAILDPAKFKQILYNYVSNALKFTNEGGTVEIRVVPEGSKDFRLEVKDNGIDVVNKTSLSFSEFKQLNANYTAKEEISRNRFRAFSCSPYY